MVRRKISPSAPTRVTPAAPTDRFCGLIILPITPPDELVPAVRMGLTLASCWAGRGWSRPNRGVEEVSLPVRDTPRHPRDAGTNGNTTPVLAKVRGRVPG